MALSASLLAPLAADATDLRWQAIAPAQAAQAFALQSTVLAALPSRLMRPHALAQLARFAGIDGQLLGGMAAGEGLVAYGVLDLHSPMREPVAAALGLAKEQLAQLALLNGAAVLPHWRHHGLHRELIQQRVALAARLGHAQVAVQAAPTNTPSLKNLLACGFLVRAAMTINGSGFRLVLRHEAQAHARRWRAGPLVPAQDVDGHLAACAAGATGHALVRGAHGELLLRYGLPD